MSEWVFIKLWVRYFIFIGTIDERCDIVLKKEWVMDLDWEWHGRLTNDITLSYEWKWCGSSFLPWSICGNSMEWSGCRTTWGRTGVSCLLSEWCESMVFWKPLPWGPCFEVWHGSTTGQTTDVRPFRLKEDETRVNNMPFRTSPSLLFNSVQFNSTQFN
jgi:hypothetical protein